jgi:hypothetical protein
MSGFARRLQRTAHHQSQSSGGGGGGSSEPTLSSTGPRVSATTTINGDLTLAANQSISAYHITGNLYLSGANCSATDCLIDGNIAVNQRPGGNYNVPSLGGQVLLYCKARSLNTLGTTGVEIDHCQIGATSGNPGTLITFADVNGSNAASGVNMHDCYCFGTPSVGSGSGYHLELIHNEGLTDSTFTNNHWEYYPPDSQTAGETTAALNLSTDFSPPSNNVYDGNWVYGGGPFQLYPYMGSGVVYKNNHFYSYDTYPGGTHLSPSVYSKSDFAAGGTSMSAWIDPTHATVFNNYADNVSWDLLSAILA